MKNKDWKKKKKSFDLVVGWILENNFYLFQIWVKRKTKNKIISEQGKEKTETTERNRRKERKEGKNRAKERTKEKEQNKTSGN